MSSGVDSRRVSRRDVVAEHLLHWAVADRHAAGDGEMTNDVGGGCSCRACRLDHL